MTLHFKVPACVATVLAGQTQAMKVNGLLQLRLLVFMSLFDSSAALVQ